MVASGWERWLSALWDILQTDEQACLGLIHSAGGRAGEVHLVEGDATTADALAYARTLSELGLVAEAQDIFAEVLRAAFGVGWGQRDLALAV